MSHRSRRSDDRDRSHSHHRYEHRHRRDDSRDREYYHSKKSSRRDKSRSRYRSSRSRSPSHSSKGYSRHHRNSRSRSPGYSSRYHRSRSRSQGHYSSSRHNDDYHRSHRSKEQPDSKLQREHSQSKHSTASHEMFGVNNTSQNPKHDTSDQTNHNEWGPLSISNQINDNSQSNDYYANDEPKTVTLDPNDPDAVLEEEKQRIQRETLERLQKHLEAEGKAYPPPKPQASHPIFANDGSFLEMFKSMQGNMQQQQQHLQPLLPQINDIQPKPSVSNTSTAMNPINRFQPINRRRGAKILKTGIVQKQRVIEEPAEEAAPSDSWNAYLKEVKRYKTVTCSDDNMTRSLVK